MRSFPVSTPDTTSRRPSTAVPSRDAGGCSSTRNFLCVERRRRTTPRSRRGGHAFGTRDTAGTRFAVTMNGAPVGRDAPGLGLARVPEPTAPCGPRRVGSGTVSPTEPGRHGRTSPSVAVLAASSCSTRQTTTTTALWATGRLAPPAWPATGTLAPPRTLTGAGRISLARFSLAR